VHETAFKLKVKPWNLLGIKPPKDSIQTSFTIGIDKPDKMVSSVIESNYPILKIKLGFDEDMEFLQQLSRLPSRRYRFDINGGWNMEKAEKGLYYINKLDTEIVEQPTDLANIKEWRYLKKSARFRGDIIVDEGLNDLGDYLKYSDFVDGINVKMAKCGGLLEAARLLKMARQNKRKVMLGCMIDSSIGVVPAFYLTSEADYFDLDSPLLICDDIAESIIYSDEKMTLADSFEYGPKLKDEYGLF